jgi:hypothetical protein
MAGISANGTLATPSVQTASIVNNTDTLTAILVGTSRNLQLASGTAGFGGGAGVIGITNATTVPTTNPTGGGILYSDSGALKWVAPPVTGAPNFIPATSLMGAAATKAGYYYTALGAKTDSTTNVTPVIGTVYAVPIWVASTATAVKIALNSTSNGGATNVTELGVYYNAAGDVPGALYFSAGTVDTSSGGPGLLGWNAITISKPFTPGLWWLALLSTSTTAPVLSALQQVQEIGQPATSVASPSVVSSNNGWRMTGQSTLPATFTPTWGTTSSPAIWLGF